MDVTSGEIKGVTTVANSTIHTTTMGHYILGGVGSGAAMGATIGTFIPIPGVGTAVGAAIGGVIGGIAGIFGGHKANKEAEAQKAAEQAANGAQLAAVNGSVLSAAGGVFTNILTEMKARAVAQAAAAHGVSIALNQSTTAAGQLKGAVVVTDHPANSGNNWLIIAVVAAIGGFIIYKVFK
jgi:uncharacterized membrane protein